MTLAAPIEVIRTALLRLGEIDIASLEDGSPAAVIANSQYELMVRNALTRHAWSFATKIVALTYQGQGADIGFPEIYQLPADQLNIMAVTANGSPLFRYRIESNRLLTFQQQPIEVRYQWRAPESEWPADFTEAIVLNMQSKFLWGLLENRQDSRLRENDAEQQLLMAMRRDKRQSPGQQTMRSPLSRTFRGLGRGPLSRI